MHWIIWWNRFTIKWFVCVHDWFVLLWEICLTLSFCKQQIYKHLCRALNHLVVPVHDQVICLNLVCDFFCKRFVYIIFLYTKNKHLWHVSNVWEKKKKPCFVVPIKFWDWNPLLVPVVLKWIVYRLETCTTDVCCHHVPPANRVPKIFCVSIVADSIFLHSHSQPHLPCLFSGNLETRGTRWVQKQIMIFDWLMILKK